MNGRAVNVQLAAAGSVTIHGAESPVQVDGREYSGARIDVTPEGVYVDDVLQYAGMRFDPKVIVTGNCQAIKCDVGEVKIKGNAGGVQTWSGDIVVEGDARHVATMTGNVRVSGRVEETAISAEGWVEAPATREEIEAEMGRPMVPDAEELE